MVKPAANGLRPRLYLCGFPKSGLHLMEQAVSAFAEPCGPRQWYGTTSWQAEMVHLEVWGPAMLAIRPGTYAKGHMAYSPPFAEMLWGLEIGALFAYRDLRDVLVSQAHHVLSEDDDRFKHPGKALYRALPDFEAVLMACLDGLGPYDGLIERWEMFAGWLDCPTALPIRYEDIRREETPSCRDILRYALQMSAGDTVGEDEVEARRGVVLEMVQRIRDRQASGTFRRGRIGDWRQAFTPAVKARFKELDRAGWLVRLGYEEDGDW